LLQTVGTPTSNYIGRDASRSSWKHNWIRLGKDLTNDFKLDILEFLLDTPIPEEFEWKSDFKYLYYKDSKILGMMIYKLIPMVGKPTPVVMHIVATEGFRKTRAGYQFMIDTFKDLAKDYSTLVTHIPNERTYIIEPMIKFGFREYSEDSYGKFYFLDLGKLG
jgi:hypothetical protein